LVEGEVPAESVSEVCVVSPVELALTESAVAPSVAEVPPVVSTPMSMKQPATATARKRTTVTLQLLWITARASAMLARRARRRHRAAAAPRPARSRRGPRAGSRRRAQGRRAVAGPLLRAALHPVDHHALLRVGEGAAEGHRRAGAAGGLRLLAE